LKSRNASPSDSRLSDLEFSLLCLASIWRLFTFIETAHRCRSMMQKKTAFSTSTKALKAFPDYLRTAAKWQ